MNRKATPHPLILIALVSLPIEVILITISGRSIIHYYLTPLPVMAILTGALIYTARRLLEKIPNGSFQEVNRWPPAILLLVVILFQFGHIKHYPEYVRASALNEYAPVIDYIAKNTEERDKALIIDTRGRTRLDEKLYVPLQKRSEIVRAGVQYLGENYQQVAQFGEWFVYRLVGR